MTIIDPEYETEWNIYDAVQFRKEFHILEERSDDEADEEYITRHLENDPRKFSIDFRASDRDNAYAEYWRIRLLPNKFEKAFALLNERISSIRKDHAGLTLVSAALMDFKDDMEK